MFELCIAIDKQWSNNQTTSNNKLNFPIKMAIRYFYRKLQIVLSFENADSLFGKYVKIGAVVCLYWYVLD